MRKVIIVSADKDRPEGRGKINPHIFVPIFAEALRQRGVDFEYYRKPSRFFRAANVPAKSIVIPIYNEEKNCEQASKLKTILCVAAIEATVRLRSPSSLLANRLRIGRIIRDKKRTNEFLVPRGVPMPRLLKEANGRPIFSNVRTGTGQPVALLEGGAPLNSERYNVEFIDTRVSFRNIEYYTVVRVMCVGPRVIAIIPRAKPVGDGNPSVHGADTSDDPDLLNHLRSVLIDARRDQFVRISGDINSALGFGFYAHDFLVERESGRIVLCEANFKFHNEVTRRRLAHIIGALSFASDITNDVVVASANAVADKLDAI